MKRPLLSALALTLALGAIAPSAQAFEPEIASQTASLETLDLSDTKTINPSLEDNDRSKNFHHFRRRRRFRRGFGRRRFRRFRRH